MTERRSDKANPRIDEQLHREVEPLERGAPAPSRAEEHRQAEAPGDGEPAPDVRPEITDDEGRVEVARHLRPSAFPAGREELMATATAENAPRWIIRALEGLPEGQRFDTPQEVWEAVRKGSS
jgi:hypothetical protein